MIGPNLRDPDGFTFHVHAEGCKDMRKPLYRNFEHQADIEHPIDFDSLRELVEWAYDGQLSDNADDPVWSTWEPYAEDFKVFNCAKGLLL